MARKTSDIALLLGHRGRSRSRKGGIGHTVVAFIDNLLGRSSSRSRRSSNSSRRSQSVSVWVLLIAVLVSFGGGFVIGGGVGGDNQGNDPLNANGGNANGPANGRRPGFVGEVDTRPLAPQAFVVSIYPKMEPEAAKSSAAALSKYLNERGIQKARPYPYPGKNGTLWVVAVYFDGEAEAQATRGLLAKVPADVPDATFVHLRKTETQWPKAWPIR